MSVKNFILYFFIFLIVGELMIRFDESFTIFEENRIVKISTDIEITPEYHLLVNDTLFVRREDFRIMVIGDSYIHGGGIDFKDNFSQQLKRLLLSKNLGFKKIWVLDVSKPSSNTLDNNETYFQFVNRFKPNVVILGYNINDINGYLDKKNDSTSKLGEFSESTSAGKSQRFIKKVYNVIYSSHLIELVFYRTHRILNAYGIIIPGSNFDRTMKVYYENKENWKKSKKLLSQVILDTEKRGIQLIVYMLPETNLLEYPQLFGKSNIIIESFFKSFSGVIYLNGSEALRGEAHKEYMLSKYDGHPNEKAHRKMAKQVFDTIIKLDLGEIGNNLK